MEQRTAPDDRLCRIDEKAHRDRLHAAGDHRFDRVNDSPEGVLSKGGRFCRVDTQEMGNARSIDVGIHQTGPRPKMIQPESQTRGHRAFADAPFAAADGNNVRDRESERSARVLAADPR